MTETKQKSHDWLDETIVIYAELTKREQYDKDMFDEKNVSRN